jgi:heme/copper-type cytochrome/quinol oxidase subunit 3
MRTHTSRTAFPIRGAKQGYPIGIWGIWLTMAVLLAALAGLVVSVVYLYWGQESWPPPGFETPPLARGAIALLLALGACLSTFLAVRQLRTDREQIAGHTLFGALVLGAGSLAALVSDLAGAPWRWDEHVYTSLFWLMIGNAAVFVGVSTLMVAAVLVQRIAGMVDAGRHLEVEVTAVFWFFTLLTVLSAFGTVHLLPYR